MFGRALSSKNKGKGGESEGKDSTNRYLLIFLVV